MSSIIKNNKQKKHTKDLIQFFLSNIASFCDKCGTKYEIKNLEALNLSPETSILQASCQKCKNLLLATVARQAGLSTKAHLLLDITPEQVTTKIMGGLISTDEVIIFHDTLKNSKTLTDLMKAVR